MKARDPNLSNQGREFDVSQDPELAAVVQSVAGWIAVVSAVGMLITALPEVLPALLTMVGF